MQGTDFVDLSECSSFSWFTWFSWFSLLSEKKKKEQIAPLAAAAAASASSAAPAVVTGEDAQKESQGPTQETRPQSETPARLKDEEVVALLKKLIDSPSTKVDTGDF